MNKEQRARLETIQADLSALQEEEQSKYDNLPENFQNGTQGERLQEIADKLQEAADSVQEALDA